MSENLNQWKKFQSDNFPGVLGAEFFDHIVGDLIGSGVDRTVFEYLPDKTCVIKFATRRGSFQNVHEWDLWQQHSLPKRTTVCDMLAPCVSISHSGNVLIQKRTKPIPFGFKLPKMVPSALDSDLKRENWGLFKGRVVCHDYGRHNAVFYASKGRNMIRADWIQARNGAFQPIFGESDSVI